MRPVSMRHVAGLARGDHWEILRLGYVGLLKTTFHCGLSLSLLAKPELRKVEQIGRLVCIRHLGGH